MTRSNSGSVGLKPITSGATVEEWIESSKYDADLYESIKRHSRIQIQMKYDVEFEYMNLLPGLLDRFHCADLPMQKRILKMLLSESCCQHILTFLRLFQDTGAVHTGDVTWASTKIEKSAEKLFRYMHTGFGDANRFYFPKNDAWIVHLLSVIHGEDRVCEVINEWTGKKLQNSFCDFAPLVEQWDTVKKYPIDWAVSMTDTHACFQVSRDIETVKDYMRNMSYKKTKSNTEYDYYESHDEYGKLTIMI